MICSPAISGGARARSKINNRPRGRLEPYDPSSAGDNRNQQSRESSDRPTMGEKTLLRQRVQQHGPAKSFRCHARSKAEDSFERARVMSCCFRGEDGRQIIAAL